MSVDELVNQGLELFSMSMMSSGDPNDDDDEEEENTDDELSQEFGGSKNSKRCVKEYSVISSVENEPELKVDETFLDISIRKKKIDIDARIPEASKVLENVPTLPVYSSLEEKKILSKKEKKKEREKTAGASWFHIRAPEITDEMKRDLEVLRMRGALDPKHFYKKNVMPVTPKYFQVGKVIDSPEDYYDRIPKKQRKRTLVEELLTDSKVQQYNSKRYSEIVQEKNRAFRRAHRKAKILKRRSKKK